MQRNIYAYTAMGTQPEYLSVNERDGNVVVTVRGPAGGATVDVTVPRAQIAALSDALRADVGREAQIKHMVDQFLRWRLPEHFNPDGGISFDPKYRSQHGPVGTNLFDATQADAMVRHMLEGMPPD